MKIRINKFLKDIAPYDIVVFYGAGHFAKIFTEALREYNVVPDFYVVTKKNESKKGVEREKIYNFEECREILKDIKVCTVVAVNEEYQKQIIDILQKNSISNYYLMTDYIWKPLNRNTYDMMYSKKNKEWYLERILEWYEDEVKCCHTKLNVLEVPKEQKSNSIVFVVNMLEPRVVKIAAELRLRNKQIYIFLSSSCQTEFHKSLVEELSVLCEVQYYQEYIEDLLLLLIQKKPDVIHIFSEIKSPYVACVLVYLKGMLAPLVFENYDIGNGMYREGYVEKYLLEKEKYCVENADGICCRGYEIDYLYENLNFKIHGKIIKFFDYCQKGEIPVLNMDENRPLSLCYVGGITTEKECPGASNACFLELGKLCEVNQCHLHLYPCEWDEERYAEYIELDEKSEYFHFHRPIPFRELRQELSKYDYGIHPIKRECIEKDLDWRLTKNKYEYGAANKFFDYLDAGLPIIAGSLNRFLELFEKEKVLLRWSMEEYDFEKMRYERDNLRKNVTAAREKLGIDNNINELIEFYDSL